MPYRDQIYYLTTVARIVLLLTIFNLLFQDSIIHSICSTHDIDFFCHMNNAKYFKELDFARFDFYFRSELSDYVEAIYVFNTQPWYIIGGL